MSEHETEQEQPINVQPASRKRLARSLIIMIIGLVIVFGGVFGFKWWSDAKRKAVMAEWVTQPPTVTAQKARSVNWTPSVTSVGQMTAINGVDISAQVGGIVTEFAFESGQKVEKGEKIFEIQHKALDAQLRQNEASKALAEITYERERRLYKQHATSAQARDQARAKYEEAVAALENTRSQIAYHVIRAPFSGRLGIRQINEGEYFKPGDTAVTLNQTRPIYVDFNVVESDIGKLSLHQPVQVESSAFPDKVFKGEVTSMESRLSRKTRALKVEAKLPNDKPGARLLPGMFVTVKLMLPEKKKIVTVPSSAVNYTLYGSTVYVLKPVKKNGEIQQARYSKMEGGKMKMVNMNQTLYKAKEVPVKTGITNGGAVEIRSGVQAGDIVATSGQIKLKSGGHAVVDHQIKLDKSAMTKEGLLKQNKQKQNQGFSQASGNSR